MRRLLTALSAWWLRRHEWELIERRHDVDRVLADEEAIRQLIDWVHELDHDPGPGEDYVIGPAAQEAVHRAMEARR